MDNEQLRAGFAGIVAINDVQIINLHGAALRLRYWSPVAALLLFVEYHSAFRQAASYLTDQDGQHA